MRTCQGMLDNLVVIAASHEVCSSHADRKIQARALPYCSTNLASKILELHGYSSL